MLLCLSCPEALHICSIESAAPSSYPEPFFFPPLEAVISAFPLLVQIPIGLLLDLARRQRMALLPTPYRPAVRFARPVHHPLFCFFVLLVWMGNVEEGKFSRAAERKTICRRFVTHTNRIKLDNR
jgi:hypothetical protein